MTSKTTGIFMHAETVGSLPHADALLQARAAYDAKTLDYAALRKIEDDAIRAAVAMQERVGLQVITDGELRRNLYFEFALTGLIGVQLTWQVEQGVAYRDTQGGTAATPKPVFSITERIRHSPDSKGARDFRFLQATTRYLAKATIGGPAIIHFFGGRAAVSEDVYPKLDDYWSDLIAAYVVELQQLREAGCSFVQFDETALIKLVDPGIREWITKRGDDPDQLLSVYTDVLAAIFRAAPPGMRVALHLCRGNNRGTWQAQGGYDGIAEMLFERLPASAFYLEYDSPRAGSFEALAKLPEDRTVVLGLLSTKTRSIEDTDAMIARIRDASRYVPIERLGVSPQCGFWGGINLCTELEAEAKLRRVVEIARRVWQ